MSQSKGSKERLLEIFQRVVPDFKPLNEVIDIPIGVIPMDALLSRLRIGFLSPDGRYVDWSDHGYGGNPHMSAAMHITGKMPEFKNSPNYENTPDDYLLRHGWIKIRSLWTGDATIFMPTWDMWWDHELTPIQEKIYNEFSRKYEKPKIVRTGDAHTDDYYDNPNKHNLDEILSKSKINEIHNINDFKFNKTKNIIQKYIESGSIPNEFIESNRYFIIGLDYMNGVVSVSTTLSKQTCVETIEYLKTNGSVQQIFVEKPEVGAQSMMRHDGWKPKNTIYGNENQLKIDLNEVMVIDLDYKKSIY